MPQANSTISSPRCISARASAMVSQGRVGTIVSARPEERRAVLEEAAGITGLHARRHEAELKLRAAEANLSRAEDLRGRVVNCFMKCEADRRGTLRSRRQIMMDDSDVPWHRHIKAAVGGIAAMAIGDPAVFVSVDAMHQGPQGGGPVIAIVDVGE